MEKPHFSPLSGAKDVPENYNLITIELEATGAKTKVTLTRRSSKANQRPMT